MHKIEQIEALIYKLQSLKKSPKFFFFDYFEKIKASVEWRRERLKQEIDQCSDAVIEEIEKAKSECMKASTQIGDISTKLDSLSYELNELKDQIKKLETSEAESERKLLNLECTVDSELSEYKCSLLGNKDYLFEIGDIEFEFKKSFGEFIQRNIGKCQTFLTWILF